MDITSKALGMLASGSESRALMRVVSPRRDHILSPHADPSSIHPGLSAESPLPSQVMAEALQFQLSVFQKAMAHQKSDFAERMASFIPQTQPIISAVASALFTTSFWQDSLYPVDPLPSDPFANCTLRNSRGKLSCLRLLPRCDPL